MNNRRSFLRDLFFVGALAMIPEVLRPSGTKIIGDDRYDGNKHNSVMFDEIAQYPLTYEQCYMGDKHYFIPSGKWPHPIKIEWHDHWHSNTRIIYSKPISQ